MWKGSPIFVRKLDSYISNISWNIYYGVNKWHAKYKILAELGKILDTAKEKIPKQCRIGDTCFTSLAATEGILHTRHKNNLNLVHKEVNDIL